MGESETARTELRVPWVGFNFVELPPHLCIYVAVALRIPLWEKGGWSKCPPMQILHFCPRSSSEIEADGAVLTVDILAAFVKVDQEQQRGYPNAKLQINLSLTAFRMSCD